MSSMRRGPRAPRSAAFAGQPGTVLESESPYGSRRLVVEYDGATTAAYLHDAGAVLGAAWIANHGQAPQSADLSRLSAGQAPLMPAAHTKHPAGRAPLDARTLRALWFEEGDGVAIIEGGQLLAVIPGWSDMARGMPGYSRDVIGQTPFGWSLDDAMEGLGPRADRAVAAAGRFLGLVPAVHARTPAGPARAWCQVLGRQRRQPADGRRLGTAADPAASLHGAVHDRHELPADARGGAGDGGPERLRADRAGDRHDHAQPRRRPRVPVARPVPVAGGDLVWHRAHGALVSRAGNLPARRGQGGRAPARRPVRAARPGGPGPDRILRQRGPGAVAVDHPDHRTRAPARQGARGGQPGHPARRAAP